MKKNLTELVFILDKSGSMSGLEKDTIGGFNSLLDQQRKVDGECVITTILFDNRYELLHDRIDIRAVQPPSPGRNTLWAAPRLCWMLSARPSTKLVLCRKTPQRITALKK